MIRSRVLRLMLATVLITPFTTAADTPLALSDLLALAAQTHPKLQAAGYLVEAAEADIDTARSAWRPSLSAGPYLSYSVTDYGSGGKQTIDAATASISVDQLLWDFGATGARTMSAKHLAGGARANEIATRRDIELNVAESYVNLAFATRLASLRTRTLSARSQLRDKVAKLVDSGVRPASDLTRAQIDLENARLDLASAESIAGIRARELGDSIGLTKPMSGELVDILKGLPPTVRLQPLKASALENRQDISADNFAILSLQSNLDVVQRDKYPILSGGASLSAGNTSESLDSTGSGTESDDDSVQWAVFVQLGWSSFNFAEQSASARSLNAKVAAGEAELRNTIRSIDTELEVLSRSMSEALKRVQTTRAVTAAAVENQGLTLKRYASGTSSILDVTDGQVTVTFAEAAALQARADAWIMYFRLMRAACIPLAQESSPTPKQ